MENTYRIAAKTIFVLQRASVRLNKLLSYELNISISKWTREWTSALDLWVFLDTSKYTSSSNWGAKAVLGKHLRTDRHRKFTAL